MENTCTNTTIIAKEKKSHLIIAWIALIVALVMLVYIGYHVLYKGIAYATKLVNNPEGELDEEKQVTNYNPININNCELTDLITFGVKIQ